jgi:hypothetical protein
MIFRQALAIGLIAAAAAVVQAQRYELDFDAASPSLYVDRWMYPFNVSPGTRIQAPSFGAVGAEGVDERDGQFLIAINTAGMGIPADLPLSNYKIQSAQLVITEAVGGYQFDGTYDRFTTYLDSSSDRAENDSDTGRPVELYGTGFRDDFEEFGWPDGSTSTGAPIFSAGSPFGVSGRGTRTVFAADAFGNDVSNNVDSLSGGAAGFDPKPLSVGQALGPDDDVLTPGSVVSAGSRFVFDINVADESIGDYLRQSLANGQLRLVVTSLHDAGLQGAGDLYPNWATSNHFSVPGPFFELTLNIVDSELPGDFDNSGTLDVGDLDQLIRAIDEGSNDAALEINGDSIVNTLDFDVWVHDWFGTYYGDANLDGEFNTVDLVAVLAAGHYEDDERGNSRWSTGDWNADRDFTSADLITALADGGYEQGPRPATIVVPEPSSLAMGRFTACALVAYVCNGWRKRAGTLPCC